MYKLILNDVKGIIPEVGEGNNIIFYPDTDWLQTGRS